MAKKIAVIVGSLRKDSLNRKMAKELIKMAPASIKLDFVEIGDLPLYNQDFDDEGQVPAAWTKFREQMKGYQGVLFVTPEYNRTIPAPLKNAIDVGSRPYGQSIWGGKPGAIISVSPSAAGGFGANHALRQALVFLDVPTLQQPEAYIGNAGNLFNDKGEIANEDTRKFVQKFIDAYAKWVETNSK
ncbi:NADPH-dependent FMN reductase [Legionella shakespearei]|uniref:Chromate reductase, Class I, flavoprotein n=1 Tax=Legionella shakespearei DSM 23087 TaxID=1122169 RepID=A0A0W0Z527_9GAMM|nr:NAD(P)H-dependent oxidoreductase [Legionella shakespearei]KTD64228.1 chromate reductase, Class I, flavoprotein [Legionella shakespearei DSM 23087]